MYKKMSYRTARELGFLIEELSQVRALYRAYTYKIVSESDYADTSVGGVRKVEINANLALHNSLKLFQFSREEIVAQKLDIEIEDLKKYHESFGFDSLTQMIESVGNLELTLITEEEIRSVNKMITGELMDEDELRDKIAKLK